MNDSFQLTMGDAGSGTLGAWTQAFRMSYNAPANSLFIDVGGAVNSSYLISGGALYSSSTIVASDGGYYARDYYDIRLYNDSAGMYLKFGDLYTGNTAYLEIGSYGGATNFFSNSDRPIYFRTAIGYSWLFGSSGVSYNAFNTNVWNTISDHRIKKNIKKADLKICFNNVKNINLYRYNYIDGFKNVIDDKTQLGYISQQVSQHFPKSVTRNKTRIEDKREIPDLSSVNIDQINFTLFALAALLKRSLAMELRMYLILDFSSAVDRPPLKSRHKVSPTRFFFRGLFCFYRAFLCGRRWYLRLWSSVSAIKLGSFVLPPSPRGCVFVAQI